MRLHVKSKPIITGLALILLFSSLSFKCSSGGSNNGNANVDPNKQFRSAAKASDDVAKGISEMIDLKRKLAQQGKMSAAEESKITDLLLKVNTADKVFVARIKAMRGTAPDASGKANLASLFAEVTSALNELSNAGLLPLGNADAKGQMQKILALATAAAQIIEAFLKP
jgi:hypothetical protein